MADSLILEAQIRVCSQLPDTQSAVNSKQCCQVKMYLHKHPNLLVVDQALSHSPVGCYCYIWTGIHIADRNVENLKRLHFAITSSHFFSLPGL